MLGRGERGEKHWTEQKWARNRRIFIRPDVPGRNYDPEATVILDTPERRKAFREAAAFVINEALSEEGSLWARGLTEEELRQPLDLEQLLNEYENEAIPSRLSSDAYEARFNESQDQV